MNRVYAVIDCNNFFVSCERVFQPQLNGRPVIVLSNNDGCAVSRSNEAKPLIPMGAPLFKHRAQLEQAGAVWLSANFQLYGDISRRVMDILGQASPAVEVYSVDEAFLQIGDLGIDSYEQWGLQLRQQILQWTGVPVSVGIGASKTLAKAAVERAKKVESSGNVLDFTSSAIRQQQLAQLPLGDVWGIGRRLAPKLMAYGLRTAADLQAADPKWLAQLYNSNGARLIQELNGVDCYGAEVTFNQPPKRNITASRSFGQRLSQVSQIEPALANFVFRAAARARRAQLLASQLGIYLVVAGSGGQTSVLKAEVNLDEPTNDPAVLMARAQQLLTDVYQAGHSYKKVGVNLGGLVPLSAAQQQLVAEADPAPAIERGQLLDAVDELNQRWGKGAVSFAAQHTSQAWQSQRAHKSAAYTTSWSQMPVISTG